MLSVLVNFAAIVLGSLAGLLFKKGIPEKVSGGVMAAVGLVVSYIGISGSLEGNNTIVLIVSLVLGTIIGSAIDIDDKLNRLGRFIENKMKKPGEKSTLAEGFVTGSLLFCIGAMAVVGSLDAGLNGNNTIIYTKSVIDMISSCMLASTLGIGVMFSAVSVGLYQGALVLMAGLLQNVLTDEAVIAEITCAGSLMILALGLNLLKITKLKVANFLPALVLVPFVYKLAELLPF